MASDAGGQLSLATGIGQLTSPLAALSISDWGITMAMSQEEVLLLLAIPAIKPHVNMTLPLKERIADTFKYAFKNEGALFFLASAADDDLVFKAVVGTLMLTGSDADRELLARSTNPLKMLAAACSGVAVDFSNVNFEGILPLMKIMQEAKDEAKPSAAGG